MTPGPKTFTGFRGHAAMIEIGDGKIRFFILAKNAREMESLHRSLFPHLPYDPKKSKRAILIEAALLPDTRPTRPTQYKDALDRLNEDLLKEESAELMSGSNSQSGSDS